MNKILFLLIGVLFLGSCAELPRTGQEGERLPPCSASGSIFASIPFQQWPGMFYGSIGSAINSYSFMDMSDITSGDYGINCTRLDEEYSLQGRESALHRLASFVPAWKEPEARRNLQPEAAGAVVLEFLRVYECALLERRHNLPIILPRATPTTTFNSGDYLTNPNTYDTNSGALDIGIFQDRYMKERTLINEELRVARPTVERLLLLTSSSNLLFRLVLDVECLKRSSIDLRNVFGLTAETTSCLPRIWDTHQSLRIEPE